MNRKGQALIEFVLILPVFLMILFLVIDFGTIYVAKMKLESTSTEIIDSYYDNHDLNTIKDKYKDYVINDSKEDDYLKLTVRSQVKLITPGLGRILSNPYEITTERYIYDE